MKHMKSMTKTARQSTFDPRQDTMNIDQAISISPPEYGIDFIDDDVVESSRQENVKQHQGVSESIQDQSLRRGEVRQGKFTRDEPPMQFQGAGNAAENHTGMPGQLKAGLEQLSGMDLSGVRVHYNAVKPAQLHALAYTQGQDIHVGPGQERHLPHEGWHVVQQMQGRAKSTIQAKGVAINDDRGLEHEADVMGAKALQMRRPDPVVTGATAQARTAETREREPMETSETSSAVFGAAREEGRLRCLSASGAGDRVIQRKVGFEFEIPSAWGFAYNDPNKMVPNKTPIVKGSGFELQSDTMYPRAKGGSTLEFVTDAIDETYVGWYYQIGKVMGGINSVCDELIDGYKKGEIIGDKKESQAKVFPASQLQNSTANAAKIDVLSSKPEFIAKPQITAGIRFDRLYHAIKYLNELPKNKNASPEEKNAFPLLSQPREEITKTTAIVESLNLGSKELKSLVMLLATYIRNSRGQVKRPKYIAPFLARTDFGAMFREIKNPPSMDVFVQKVLAAAEMSQEEANSPLFAGGITQKDKISGRDTPYEEIKVRAWLTHIAQGKDILTEAAHKEHHQDEAKTIKSMGEYGGRMDPVNTWVGTYHGKKAPIVEFRVISGGLPRALWGGFAYDVFNFIWKMNNASAAKDAKYTNSYFKSALDQYLKTK